MAREKTQGRESVVAIEPQEHKGKELDPGFRRDDEVGGLRERKPSKSKWIPAFAGMTAEVAVEMTAEMTERNGRIKRAKPKDQMANCRSSSLGEDLSQT